MELGKFRGGPGVSLLILYILTINILLSDVFGILWRLYYRVPLPYI